MERSRESPSFDTASIDEALGRLHGLGGDTLVDKMIVAFLANASLNVDAACAALAWRDADGVERAAHSLKSSAANLGAVRLQELARSAEQGASIGDGSDATWARLASWVEALPAALAEVRRHLTTQFPKESPKR